MLKTQIGLGVLSIPAAFDTLGIVPGIISLCAITAITTWSNYIIGVFKLRHREVYGIDDVGGLLFGRPGKIVLGTAFVLCELVLAGGGDVALLILIRVDLCCGLWNARHFYWPKCRLLSRHLHRGLCCRRCYYSMRPF